MSMYLNSSFRIKPIIYYTKPPVVTEGSKYIPRVCIGCGWPKGLLGGLSGLGFKKSY